MHNRILWYVSSHGWGHAARQRELIRQYRKRNPGSVVLVSTDVPDWFWKGQGIDLVLAGSPSPVVKERGWFIDTSQTRECLVHFLEGLNDNLSAEMARQDELHPDLVVSDIDPLPIAAASKRGIPAVGVANFTWDWIMKQLFPGLERAIEPISDLYRAGTYLRLPTSPDYSPFETTLDVPLLAGGEQVGAEAPGMGSAGSVTCLVALREMPPGLDSLRFRGLRFISSSPMPLHDDIFNFGPDELASSGISFSHLVAASDVVVSKAGYGIVSQILAMGKRCVLLGGRNFPEEPYLLDYIRGRPATAVLELKEISGLQEAVREVLREDAPDPEDACGANFIVSGGYLDI